MVDQIQQLDLLRGVECVMVMTFYPASNQESQGNARLVKEVKHALNKRNDLVSILALVKAVEDDEECTAPERGHFVFPYDSFDRIVSKAL